MHFFKEFSLLKSRKREILHAGADVASGPSGRVTRGTRDHRTGATRRGGQVAKPWVAHAGRMRRIVARPRGKEVGRWRAHGSVGPG